LDHENIFSQLKNNKNLRADIIDLVLVSVGPFFQDFGKCCSIICFLTVESMSRCCPRGDFYTLVYFFVVVENSISK